MEAGKLNRKITFQAKSATYGNNGEPIYTWADIYSPWAQVITTGGGEFYAAQKLNESTSCLFKVRYTTQIDVTNRILYNGKTFEILSLNDVDGMHVELQISAKEVV